MCAAHFVVLSWHQLHSQMWRWILFELPHPNVSSTFSPHKAFQQAFFFVFTESLKLVVPVRLEYVGQVLGLLVFAT